MSCHAEAKGPNTFLKIVNKRLDWFKDKQVDELTKSFADDEATRMDGLKHRPRQQQVGAEDRIK